MKRGRGTVYWSAAGPSTSTPGGPIGPTGSRKLALGPASTSRRPFRRAAHRLPRDAVHRAGEARRPAARAADGGRVDRLAVPDDRGSAARPAPKPIQQAASTSSNGRTDCVGRQPPRVPRRPGGLLPGVVHRGALPFVYLLKVTTPGVFRAMPAQICGDVRARLQRIRRGASGDRDNSGSALRSGQVVA